VVQAFSRPLQPERPHHNRKTQNAMNAAMGDTSFGRIDVHSHLLPNVDDGCSSVEESITCAQRMVAAGYTHSFCTPHIWPNLKDNTIEGIQSNVTRLEAALNDRGVPLRLMPGGELNLRPDMPGTPIEQIPTYGMARRYCLFDIWVDQIPAYFWEGVEWLQSLGLKVILAHPERMRAVQDQPGLAEEFAERGLLLQGNLQCLGDPPHTHTYRLAEQFLQEGRYFMLGSDLHNLGGLPLRLAGLATAIELVGDEKVWKLMRENPLEILRGE
jgi:protein-tyrosine phosphatase